MDKLQEMSLNNNQHLWQINDEEQLSWKKKPPRMELETQKTHSCDSFEGKDKMYKYKMFEYTVLRKMQAF